MHNLRLLVGLDNTDMDQHLLAYTKQLAGFLTVDKIYLMHVARDLQIPEEIGQKYPLLVAPKDETLEKEINFLADQYFEAGMRDKIKVEIKEGNPAKELLHWAKIKEIDLALFGRKKPENGTNALPTKMVNVGDASVLLVPQADFPPPKTIHVAFDFSEVSMMALETGLSIAAKIEAQLICHHVYQVPSGYHKTGRNFEEFAEIMLKNVIERKEKLDGQIGADLSQVNWEFTLDKDDAPAALIGQFAHANGADLLVIGSKGRTAAASVLLGSVAEKSIHAIQDLPVLVVKKKGENMGFLDALLKL